MKNLMTIYHFVREIDGRTGKSTLKVSSYECSEGKVKYSIHTRFGNDMIDKNIIDVVSQNGHDLYTFDGNPERARAIFNEYYSNKIKEYQSYIDDTVFDPTKKDMAY